jgi:hypothetical protein
MLPRFRARAERAAKIARIVLEAGGNEASTAVARATLAGSEQRLRGLPCVARGVRGVPGTDPVEETIRRLG